MKLIKIGFYNIKLLCIMIIGGLSLFSNLLLFSINNLTILSHYSYIFNIASSLGMSLSFIFIIIFHIKYKKKRMNIKRLKYANYKYINYRKFKYIFLTSVLDFIQSFISNEFCKKIELNMWIFDILFIYLFSFLFLNFEIYRHQHISMLIIILIGILLIIITDNYENNSDKKYRIIIKFICEIIFSLRIVINKYTMVKNICFSYEVCFFQGIIAFILYLIFSLIVIFLHLSNHFENYFNEFKDNKLKESLIFLLIIIIQFIFNICIFETIERMNSFYIMIIIIIGHLVFYFKKLIVYKNNIINIINIVGLCLILFMTLIFNEIIILNFCGLQKYTKKNILYENIENTMKNYLDDFDPINRDNNNEKDDIDERDILNEGMYMEHEENDNDEIILY